MSTTLLGKHCNRLQTLHKTFAVAIERLYLHKTTCTINVPEELQVVCVTHFEEVTSLEFVKKYLTYYKSVRIIL